MVKNDVEETPQIEKPEESKEEEGE